MMSTYTPSRLQGRKPKGDRIDFETIRSVAQCNALAICRRVLPGGKVIGAEYTVRNPKRADNHPGSFKVNVASGRWSDFATGEGGGDLIALVAWLYDIPQSEAARRLASLLLLQAEVIR
jgi:hypothetical protein